MCQAPTEHEAEFARHSEEPAYLDAFDEDLVETDDEMSYGEKFVQQSGGVFW